jgi:hypothetical protein
MGNYRTETYYVKVVQKRQMRAKTGYWVPLPDHVSIQQRTRQVWDSSLPSMQSFDYNKEPLKLKVLPPVEFSIFPKDMPWWKRAAICVGVAIASPVILVVGGVYCLGRFAWETACEAWERFDWQTDVIDRFF